MEPTGLGDKLIVVKGAGADRLLFRFEYKTSVICYNANTQNVKIARRDRPHILASHRCETFKNHLHIYFTLKKLNDNFYQYKYMYSFYVADQDATRNSFCSVQEKCLSFAEPYTIDSQFSPRVFPSNLLFFL